MEKPKIAAGEPLKKMMKPGSYFWCACGLSASQPFCDGSHVGTGITPVETRIEEEKEVYWCMCKHSHSKPFCDGTHRKL
ncbi:MAG: CDGSH iron-sulfur domain-containing protein [Bacteroidales bacterium]|nr:CDGSH iron-sulfur domain-containing protein [Bacteroidales bacterium]